MTYACTEERFLSDVKDHVMTILNDDGINRHLHFAKPGSSSYSFHIVTFCGYLVMTGDMGAWILSRLKDNFEFIRSERTNADRLYINPSYWSEKIQAQCKHTGIEKYSADKFNTLVRERFAEYKQDNSFSSRKVDKDDLTTLGVLLEEKLIDCGESYEEASRALDDYNDEWNERFGRSFLEDLWDHDLRDYTFGFIWACYAWAYAVRTYDQYKDGLK